MKSKSELVRAVAEKHGLGKRKAKKIVNSVFAEIQASVLDGSRVMIRGFGTFLPRKTRASTRLPNGTMWTGTPRTAVRFEPHKASGGDLKHKQTSGAPA